MQHQGDPLRISMSQVLSNKYSNLLFLAELAQIYHEFGHYSLSARPEN